MIYKVCFFVLGDPCYICVCLSEKKKNKSGSISIQILEKRGRKNHLLKSIGSSSNEEEVQRLKKEAEEFIRQKTGQFSLDLLQNEPLEWFNQVSQSIKQVRLLGPELLLGKLYDEIGFNQVKEDLLKHLVITRLVYPVSKLKTVRYLKEHQGIEYQVEQIYRYLDKLNKDHKKKVEQISYDHTLKILQGKISVVFYDVTTLYFEIDKEDELRKTGFSKEGKHQHPQILLGLLVGTEGYPLAYEIFEGNKYEGHTMLSVVEQFTNRFKIERIVVVADFRVVNKSQC